MDEEKSVGIEEKSTAAPIPLEQLERKRIALESNPNATLEDIKQYYLAIANQYYGEYLEGLHNLQTKEALLTNINNIFSKLQDHNIQTEFEKLMSNQEFLESLKNPAKVAANLASVSDKLLNDPKKEKFIRVQQSRQGTSAIDQQSQAHLNESTSDNQPVILEFHSVADLLKHHLPYPSTRENTPLEFQRCWVTEVFAETKNTNATLISSTLQDVLKTAACVNQSRNAKTINETNSQLTRLSSDSDLSRDASNDPANRGATPTQPNTPNSKPAPQASTRLSRVADACWAVSAYLASTFFLIPVAIATSLVAFALYGLNKLVNPSKPEAPGNSTPIQSTHAAGMTPAQAPAP